MDLKYSQESVVISYDYVNRSVFHLNSLSFGLHTIWFQFGCRFHGFNGTIVDSVLFNLILFIGNLMSVLIKLAGSLMMVTRIHLCMSVPPITEERLASSLYCVTLYITQYTLNWRVKMTYSSLCSCHHHFVAIVA